MIKCKSFLLDRDGVLITDKKHIINKQKSLQYKESDKEKVYKYQGKTINRKDFIILLGCEEK